jgi:hypothetical protein
MTASYRAPWGYELKISTLIGSGILGVPIVVQLLLGLWLIPVLFGTFLVLVAIYCVRGYELAPGELRVRRLLFDTRWPIDESATATVRPKAMRGSWRLWGNGGLFAISGIFSGSGLGRYHAFVTDPARTVVVTTRRGIVVVSPDRPAEFAAAIEQVRYPRTP